MSPTTTIGNYQFFNTSLPDWFNKTKADTQSFFSNQNFEKKLLTYYKEFKTKFDDHKLDFNKISFNLVEDNFLTGLRYVLDLSPDDLIVGVTSDVSIYYRFSINTKNFYFEIYFDSEDDEIEIDTVLSIFENKKCVFSFGGPFKKSLLELEKFEVKPNLSEEHYPNHELSGSFITES